MSDPAPHNDSVGYNRLSREKSPYLLQHKDNPVHWYAWGTAALEAARAQDKPIFLSIGYSTCYWCHVMEKDSFETEAVAQILNQHFIAVKVDREERPDVDQIYMDAVVGITGHGGWPMSVFLNGEGKPFWGGTFFYREQFIQILRQIHQAWVAERERVQQSAEHITDMLRERSLEGEGAELERAVFRNAIQEYSQAYDTRYAGFGKAPKFPPSLQLSLLMRLYQRSPEAHIQEMVEQTLQRMARGGMYDQLAGGFARYSTDERWLVPHFEKMLYDNALLTITYLEAYQLFKNDTYAEVARETLDYVLSEMRASDGGFYSAQDAGEVGKEGQYYVWSDEELRKILSADEYSRFAEVFGVSREGNFEHGRNVLSYAYLLDWNERKSALLVSAREKLLVVRRKRVAPHKDDKVLTSWNGLMIEALAKGFQVLGERRYLAAAQQAAQFIGATMVREGALLRRYRAGEAAINGCLDDYAFFISGLIQLYQADFNLAWLSLARKVQHLQDALLWDKKEGCYFYSDAQEIILKKKDLLDGATPSGNAVSLLNLLRLYDYDLREEWREKAKSLGAIYSSLTKGYPHAFPKALQALDYLLGPTSQVVIVRGAEDVSYRQLIEAVQDRFLPRTLVAVTSQGRQENDVAPALLQQKVTMEGKTTFYVCEDHACKLPVTEIAEAMEMMRGI